MGHIIVTLSLLTPGQKKQYLLSGFLSLINSLLGIISMFIIVPIISVIANPASPPGWLGYFVKQLGPVETKLAAGFLAIVVAWVFLLRSFFSRLAFIRGNRFFNDNWQLMSKELFAFFLREDFLTHCQRSTPHILNALNFDTQSYFLTLKSMQEITVQTTTLLLLIVFLAIANWKIALIMLLLAPMLLLTLHVFQRPRTRLYGQNDREASLSLRSYGSRTMGAWREVRVQQKTKAFIARYYDLAGQAIHWRKKLRAQSNIVEVAQTLMTACLFAGLAAFLMQDMEISLYIPQISLVLLSLLRVFPSVRAINQGLNTITTHTTSLDHLLDLHRQKKSIPPAASTTGGLISFDREIRIKGMDFAYPNTHRSIFQKADMVIPAGATVAIVGESGIGKTTLADLLLGLIKPSAGQILYDGVDIAPLTNPDLSRLVAYVPQTTYLNGDTILNNILFEHDEEPDLARVWQCLEFASLKSMVEYLPDRLDTLVGEGGILISGGQRQRLALARALYRDFKLLVMDEAISSLDQDTETAVLDSLGKIPGTKTLVIITHRRKTAEQCDIIYCIKDGKIIREAGSLTGGLFNET